MERNVTEKVRYSVGAKGHRHKGSRRSKGITRTVVKGSLEKWFDKVAKNIRAALRGLKRDLLYILAAIGGVWVIYHAAIWLGERFGGG